MTKQPPPPPPSQSGSNEKSKSTKKVRRTKVKEQANNAAAPDDAQTETDANEDEVPTTVTAPKLTKPKSRATLLSKTKSSKQMKKSSKVATKVPNISPATDTHESSDEQQQEDGEENATLVAPIVVQQSSTKSRIKEKTNPKHIKQAKSKEKFKKSTKTTKTSKAAKQQQHGSKSSDKGSSTSSLKPDGHDAESEGGSGSSRSKSMARPSSKARPKSKGRNVVCQQSSATKRIKSQSRPKSRPAVVKSKGRIVGKGPKSKERLPRQEKSKSRQTKQSAIKVSSKVRGKQASGKRSNTSLSQATPLPNPSQTSNPPTHIIIMGNSPNDAQAMDLLKSLYEQISGSKDQAVPAEANDNKQAKKTEQMSKTKQQQPGKGPSSPNTASKPVVTEQPKLEELYDEMIELINNVHTLKDSYDKIIQSLVNLQQRRPKANKTLMPKATATAKEQQKVALAPPAPSPPPVKAANPLLDRFMNPDTRDESFTQLFAAIDRLKSTMEPFMRCFDENGYFNKEAYERAPILVADRDAWLGQIRSLSPTVSALLRQYSEELLDMFRITSGPSSLSPDGA